MLILGILSMLQIAFLPGYLAVRWLRMDDGAIKTCVLSLTMSLVINHLVVFALVTLHVYYRLTIYCVFGIELAILVWMHYARLGMPAASLLAEDWQRVRNLLAEVDGSEPPTRWLGRIIVFTAVVTLLIYLLRFADASHIFSAYDAVFSWNRWAIDWHNNRFPYWTHEYPQLLPSNWSISYVFIGSSTVQLFAKTVTSLLPLFIVLAVTDLGLRSRSLGLILAVSTTGLLLLRLIGDLIDSGYADTPMACMAFASIYMLLIAKDAASDRERRKSLLIGTVLCAGAALTKQPGLYLAAVYPLLSFLLVLNESKHWSLKEKAKVVVLLYAASSVLLAPWYVFARIRMMMGMDESNVLQLMGESLHKGRSTVERVIFATSSIEASLGRILVYFVIPLGLFYAAFNRTWRWLLFGVVLPWSFVWAILFSYDTRNLALVAPLVGVALGIGLYEGLSGYAGKFVSIVVRLIAMKKAEWRVIALLLVSSVILSFLYPGERLIHHQLELQKETGNEALNRALYEYYEKYGFKGKIASSYAYLEYLPALEHYCVHVRFQDVTLEQFLGSVENADAAYLLSRRSLTDPHIDQYIRERINSGQYTTIFNVEGFELVELHGRDIRALPGVN